MFRFVVLIFIACLISLPSFAGTLECKISSKWDELKTGINKKILCEDVLFAIEQDTGMKITVGKLKIKTHWAGIFQIGMSFHLRRPGKNIRGNGIEYWSPEDNTFVIEKISF